MYYTAGYYLVIPKHERGTVNGNTFVNRTWSVSAYISHVFPGDWGFRWNYRKRDVPKGFTPDATTLIKLHSWVEAEFEQGNYGWPGFFVTREKALEFKSCFLSTLPQVKLLGLFLHEKHFPAALGQIQPPSVTGWFGMDMMLERKVAEPETGEEIGFDLLGVLQGGGYDPFSYHVLEAEYQRRFGVTLNEYGLFTTEADCQRGAAYTDAVADEPAVWLPFKVKLFA